MTAVPFTVPFASILALKENCRRTILPSVSWRRMVPCPEAEELAAGAIADVCWTILLKAKAEIQRTDTRENVSLFLIVTSLVVVRSEAVRKRIAGAKGKRVLSGGPRISLNTARIGV